MSGDAYRFYRQYLQLLTWQQRQSDADSGEEFTWMLKCPFHLPYIKVCIHTHIYIHAFKLYCMHACMHLCISVVLAAALPYPTLPLI